MPNIQIRELPEGYKHPQLADLNVKFGIYDEGELILVERTEEEATKTLEAVLRGLKEDEQAEK